MSTNQKYKRYFIILENEDRGFQKDGKSVPKGYAKIEARSGKGVLDLHVQDLKYFNNADYIYRGYLVNTNKESDNAVDLGSIAIDKRGKGSLKYKFDPSNVDKMDMDIGEFNIVAVIAKPLDRDTDGQLQGPLVGYIDKNKVRWKDYISIPVVKKTKNDDVELEGKYKEKYDEIVGLIEQTTTDDVAKTSSYDTHSTKRDEHETTDNMNNTNNKTNNDNNTTKPSTIVKDEDKKPGVIYLTEKDMIDLVPAKNNNDNNTNRQNDVIYLTEDDMIHDVQPLEGQDVEKNNQNQFNTRRGSTVYLTEADMLENKQYSGMDQYRGYQGIDHTASKVNAQYQLMNEPDTEAKRSEVYLKEYHKTVYKYLKDVLKHHRRIDPFEKNIEGYKWWEIKYDQQTAYRQFLPFFGYVMGSGYYNPLMMYRNNSQELLGKYGHYLFGIAYDNDMEVEHYVYGVPGRFNSLEQPFQGMTGFVSWHAMQDREPRKGDYGYWLLHLDPKVGNVAYPLKPTTPPM